MPAPEELLERLSDIEHSGQRNIITLDRSLMVGLKTDTHEEGPGSLSFDMAAHLATFGVWRPEDQDGPVIIDIQLQSGETIQDIVLGDERLKADVGVFDRILVSSSGDDARVWVSGGGEPWRDVQSHSDRPWYGRVLGGFLARILIES